MKSPNDTSTIDLIDGSSVTRQRGRPRTGVAMTGAERQQERRRRLAHEGKGVLTVEVSLDVLAALDAFVRSKPETKGAVVDRVLRDRLMRKR
jgi:hypothetical protein